MSESEQDDTMLVGAGKQFDKRKERTVNKADEPELFGIAHNALFTNTALFMYQGHLWQATGGGDDWVTIWPEPI